MPEPAHPFPPLPRTLPRTLAPGLLLCGAVTLASAGLHHLEEALFGRAWLETLVLAILIGTAVRTAWSPGARWLPGIAFGAKTLLEIAVMLLGALLGTGVVASAGPALLLGIAGVVALAIPASYGIGRLLGLPPALAVLVAGGNSICGNAAIAAIAPAIGAKGEDVASSIAFTAVLGIPVVLALPLAVPLFGFTDTQYGVFAGLTVYAVPQVFAATAPVSALSLQVGMLVKLVRVLTLAPVVLALTLAAGRRRPCGGGPCGGRFAVHRAVPWFIVGFLALAALRAAGLVPPAVLPSLAGVADLLTDLSMAGLGLSVDVRRVARAGVRVTAAAVLSLAALAAIGAGLIVLLGIR